MQKLLLKIVLVVFFITSLSGPLIVAHAEPFNGYVSDCLQNQKDCKQDDQKNGKKSADGKQSNGSIISIWDVTKMIFALLFVIALLYFLLKFINKKSRSYQHNRVIQNIGGTALGGNRSLQIVKAGKRILILGVGEDIRLLKEIEDENEVDEFVKYYNDQLEQTLEPRDIVTKVVQSLKSKKANEKTTQTTSFQNILKEQLTSIKKERNKILNNLEKKEKKTDE